MNNIWVIARNTYRHIGRQPLFYILLLSFAFLIFFSQYVILFNFNSAMGVGMMREMGISTITLWGFLVVALFPVFLITSEVEDRITLTLLSKPIKRSEFLWGRLMGVVYPVCFGFIVLALVLLVTLWFYSGSPALFSEKFSQIESHEKIGVWGYIVKYFLMEDGLVVLQGTILSFFQVMILAAISVSVSVFFPMAVSIVCTTLFFMIGNIAPYLKSSLSQEGVSPVFSFLGDGMYYLLPNLGYFNLQSAFSEGRIISLGYLFFAGGYGLLYLTLIMWGSSMIFERKEIS